MASIGETFLRNLSEGASEGADLNLGWIIWLFVSIAVLVVGFIVLTHFKRHFDFDGNGEPHGYNEITRIGDYPLRGNLATYKMIDDDELKMISDAVPEYENFYDVVLQMRKEDNLHLYTFKITDDSDIQDKLGSRARIMCAYPLESQDIYWTSQKGKLSITSILRKEKTRYISVIKSKKITVKNEDGNKDDWYVLVPMPRTITSKTVGFGGLEELKTTITIKEIVNASALIPRINLAGFVADAVIKNQTLIDEKESAEDFLAETTIHLKEANQKIQKKNYLLSQKKYVDIGKTDIKKSEANDLAFMLGGMIVTFMMMMIFPSFLPDVPNSPIFGFAISVGIMGLIWKVQRDKKPKIEEDYDYS